MGLPSTNCGLRAFNRERAKKAAPFPLFFFWSFTHAQIPPGHSPCFQRHRGNGCSSCSLGFGRFCSDGKNTVELAKSHGSVQQGRNRQEGRRAQGVHEVVPVDQVRDGFHAGIGADGGERDSQEVILSARFQRNLEFLAQHAFFRKSSPCGELFLFAFLVLGVKTLA